MTLPPDYAQRVYAGWLGKCIGVRFGAPLEGWTYEAIRDNLGELTTYAREDSGKIFKPDDDTAVPMILIRALEDYGASRALTSEQIAETWLNYLGDQHGTLWWGGYGISTEHTAYMNLMAGIPAPRSGSIAQNGAALAEQIGGQIFSDIWGLVAPNDPELAAEFAEKAACITHDGDGVQGGRFIAALVSAAFSERDPRKLIDIGLEQVDADSEFALVVRSVGNFHTKQPDDWRAAFAYLKANFGYDRYPGEVHIIPNAGVVALGLLYGAGDFSRSIQITNMCGWDTDCNVGNVGAIIGTAVGVEGIDASWRVPMNDLLVASSIIGTRNLLTIPQCADLFVTLGRQLHGETAEATPRYHFRYPGSTNNFTADGRIGRPIHWRQHRVGDTPTLQTAVRKLKKKGEMRIGTRTYYRARELSSNYYEARFTPLIYPGQTITATVFLPADAPDTILAGVYVHDLHNDAYHQAQATPLAPGQTHTLTYAIPAMTDVCLDAVGIAVRNIGELWETGAFHIIDLDWSGTPDYTCTFTREKPEVDAISGWTRLRGYWRLDGTAYDGSGIGQCETYSGDIAWTDITLTAELIPLTGDHHHIMARVGGARRSYTFGLGPDSTIALYKMDRTLQTVATAPFQWMDGEVYKLKLTAQGDTLTGTATGPDGGTQAIRWRDEAPFLNGQIGLSTWHGAHTRFTMVRVGPAEGAD